ncbi:hybrid sensor histidine kinase/response regulator transcription factor [Salinimicrobium xinjiangense]|uniref:hybrid sensor histidine kinase/response regulator transcription factor n=1 Tax=Salinimicrobium xinjiangense TaxID=438596 RepID=UPI00040A5BC9|nr:two-component regulator propeller domain-containing protein [Salinimicrobium xinjiangense]
MTWQVYFRSSFFDDCRQLAARVGSSILSDFQQVFPFLLFIILSLSHSPTSAQNKQFQKYQFKELKKIPTQRAVASISQDQQGFIWMGTNGLGLNRYNGLDYTSYQFIENDSTSLNNSLIHVTFVDTQNRLWVGTERGLELYNRDQNNFIHINLLGEAENAGKAVHAILEMKNGDILVGTHQHGLYRIDSSSRETSSIRIEAADEIRNFLINDIAHFDNRILLGTNRGLYEYSEDSKIVAPLDFMTANGKQQISAHIQTTEVDGRGSIWLGTTTNGLYKIDGNENGRYAIEHLPITSKRILSLLSTPRKTILCGTENDGMFEIDRKGNILNHYLNNKNDDNGIKSNSIWSLFLDDQERIWIGYYNNGVGVYDELYDKFADIESKSNNPNSLESSSVTGIIKDEKGRLWIGMDGGGIDIYNPVSGKFTHLLNNENEIANGLDSPDVQTLFMDSKGNIWVGTWDYGIYFLEKGSKSFRNFSVQNTGGEIDSNRILSFSEDSSGTIWIGTFSRGIHSFHPRKEKFTIYDEEPFIQERINFSDVRRVYVDSRDNIWIGGSAGLFKIKMVNGKVDLEVLSQRFYKDAGEQSYRSQILDIYEDSSQNIWIGTDGLGLCKYDMKKDSFSWIEPETGFNKVTVSSIIQDDSGAIWVAGNNGISKLDREMNTLKNFSISDGLLSDDFNNSSVYKDQSGTIYFGSYEGVNYFNPENLTFNKNPSHVYLTDFKVFNKSINPNQKNSPLEKVISQTDEISLDHSQSVFTIDFASIDFTRPEKIQFAYYLEGFEDNWNYVQSSRSATYTNLPPGSYTFKVKATNSDGLWEAEPTILNIIIQKPWWFTNVALLSYVLVFLLICYVILRFFNSRLNSKRAIEQERTRHLQEEALNDKKIQFFTNISHEFRTPLTLILSPLQDILENKSLPEKLKGKVKIINKNTIRLKRLIDELMDFRKLQFEKIPLKISPFDINELLYEITGYFVEEAQQRNIAVSIDTDRDIIIAWADRDKLEKILFNILSNAFKSTPNNGIITVTTKREMHIFKLIESQSPLKAFEISIEDTGKGIQADELHKIFDRFYQIKDRNDQYYSGTGIGLEVVRSFIELHRGDIEVESELGVGTKFRILLPMDKDFYDPAEIKDPEIIMVQPETELQKSNSIELSTKKQDKKTLLIVEDNTELRSYIKQELSSDYKVVVAENGQEGMEKAKKYLPDVIITDVIMPVMHGYDFCSSLKKDLKTSHIPVLMLTAKAQTDDWVEGLEAGADVYLNKPFEMKVMRSQLRQLVANRSLLYSKYMGDFNKTEVDSHATSLDQQFILEIIRYTKENIKETNLNVEKLADEFNLSRSQLYRKIKTLTGLTANELIRKIRLERAKELLEEPSAPSVSEISYHVGFSSPSYFSKCFKTHFGVLPTEIKDE